MASGLLALLDDVSSLAKLAATSVDDIATYSAQTTGKVAGLVIDDTAVTPKYVIGIRPERELPIIWRISKGSLRNKLLILIPLALVLGYYAPFLITPLLMLGGLYLAYEGAEKVLEWFGLFHHASNERLNKLGAEELERRTVASAIRTDFILSAEIVAMSLAQVTELGTMMQASVMVAVGIALTFLVYGVVAIIVKLDDLGMLMIKRNEHGILRALGKGILVFTPKFLWLLGIIGTIAMLYVSSGILDHGFHELAWDIVGWYHVQIHALLAQLVTLPAWATDYVLNPLLDLLFALCVGAIILLFVQTGKALVGLFSSTAHE